METMRVRVRSVRVLAKERLAVARVTAASTRKVRGKIAARVELVVTFQAEGIARSALAIRARAAALDFLDVA
jgi:hypothetical protein